MSLIEFAPEILEYQRLLLELTRPKAAALLFVSSETFKAWELGKNRMPLGYWELWNTKVKKLNHRKKHFWLYINKPEKKFTFKPFCPHRLKEQRLFWRLTQAEAAKKIHVTQAAWSSWESGKTKMPDGLRELWFLKNKFQG